MKNLHFYSLLFDEYGQMLVSKFTIRHKYEILSFLKNLLNALTWKNDWKSKIYWLVLNKIKKTRNCREFYSDLLRLL